MRVCRSRRTAPAQPAASDTTGRFSSALMLVAARRASPSAAAPADQPSNGAGVDRRLRRARISEPPRSRHVALEHAAGSRSASTTFRKLPTQSPSAAPTSAPPTRRGCAPTVDSHPLSDHLHCPDHLAQLEDRQVHRHDQAADQHAQHGP
jgi:hypothetical protein